MIPHRVQPAPHYQIDPSAAHEGLVALREHTKSHDIHQRADVIEHFMRAAAAANEQTGDESFGLYFADSADTGRDRYFIAKYRDDRQRTWFMLETVEGERATYMIPRQLLDLIYGPFKSAEAEIDAIVGHSKADVRTLGTEGGYAAQVIHSPGWTPGTHIAEMQQRMNGWELSS